MTLNMVFLFIATQEIFFIILIVVLLFGSKKIPELARGLGKGIREFKNATGDIQEEIRKTSREITDQVDVSKESRPKSTNNSTKK